MEEDSPATLQRLETNLDVRLAKIEQQHDVIVDFLRREAKRKQSGLIFGLEDENPERGNWTGKFDFFLSCLGFAVGLGNVWRFPYLCYRNGGGAFFIPYIVMLCFVGMPMFFLEVSLGQFSSMGPLTCWGFCPLFQGVGAGMMIVSALVAIYYNIIIAWSIYYFFASFTSVLPWEDCSHSWNTHLCLDRVQIVQGEMACYLKGWRPSQDGACYLNKTIVSLHNQTLARENSIERRLPSEEYFEIEVTGSEYSGGLDDLGPIRWRIALCYLLAFLIVVLALSKSIKSSGKVVYFTATFPYVVLIILFVRGLMLDGAADGIEWYIKPRTERLGDAGIWKDAAVQIFMSLSASLGGLIALSSYNRFHNNCLRDAITVSIGNCLTSVFAGFVIFSYLGSLAKFLDRPIEDVVKSGPSLAFIVYPYAVTRLPAAPVWSVLFFTMLLTLGVDSQFVHVEILTTSLMDRFPRLREMKIPLVSSICGVFFLLGLTLTTNGGIYMLELMDTYSGGWSLMFISLCECFAIGYLYGVRRFLQDVETMIGSRMFGCMPFYICKFCWGFACWAFLTPICVAFILVFAWVDYSHLEGEEFPSWSDGLGWLMTLVVIVAIVGGAVFTVGSAEGSLSERLRAAVRPTSEWGPALVKHRKLVASYVPGYEVDPWGKDEDTVKTVCNE